MVIWNTQRKESDRVGHESGPEYSDQSEHFVLIRQMERLEDAQRKLLSVERANGRKLDLLLTKTAQAEEIVALTAQLSADDAELQASIDAAKIAAPTTKSVSSRSSHFTREVAMASAVIEPLRVAIEKSKTVKGGAKILIDGFKQRLDDAKTEALKNGATEAELAPFIALTNDLTTGSDALQAAVEANTPSGPVVP